MILIMMMMLGSFSNLKLVRIDSSRQPPRLRNAFRDGRNAIPESDEDTEEDAGNGRGFADRRPAPVTNGGPRSMQVSTSSKRSADSQPVKPARSSSSAGSNKESSQEPMELINVLDGKTIVDTLHFKSHNVN